MTVMVEVALSGFIEGNSEKGCRAGGGRWQTWKWWTVTVTNSCGGR